MRDALTIGKLASLAGVTADTIRYYERLGLMPRPARTPSGYRQYSTAAVKRLALVRNAQQFGFSLKEIASFVRVRDAGGRPCHDVRFAAERRLEEVNRQIAALMAQRDRMADTLRTWDVLLAQTPPDRPARLLESLKSRDVV